MMDENQISNKIKGAIFDVFNHFSPGFSESFYITALHAELEQEELKIRKEVPTPVD